MVLLVETVDRSAVDAEQRRLPVGLVEPVEIDQEAHDAVAEAMAHRLEPRMHDVAEKERGAAGAQLAVIDGHRIALRKRPDRRIAGNARSDDRDVHVCNCPCLVLGKLRCVAAQVSVEHRRPSAVLLRVWPQYHMKSW